MKSLITLTIATLLTVGGYSVVWGQSRFSVAVNVAPTFSHTNWQQVAPIPDPVTQSPTTVVGSRSNAWGYSIGVLLHYNFDQKWSILTGIRASHAVWGKSIFSENAVDIPIQYTYGHPFRNAYSTPLQVNFRSSGKRLSPYFSAGATFNYPETSYLLVNGDEIPVKFGKAVVINPIVGAGVDYRLSQRCSLMVQPTLQYDVQDHSSYTFYHSYVLSLQTQLLYHF